MLFHTPTKYGSDRFRQIFIDHWERWWDYRQEEIPADQRAYVQKIVEKMTGCRNPHCGCARYVSPECHPGRRLAATWRYLLCKRLRQLQPYDGRLPRVIDNLYRQRRGLQVCTDSFYPKGVAAASYIGRYMGHPPLAMSHLTLYDGRQVQFWYQETATGFGRDVTLFALDFISLIIQHLPPKGMQLMRHAGLYARNTKAKWAEKVRLALDAIHCQFPLFDLNPFVKSYDPLTWRQRFKTSFGHDPLECPNCQTTMVLVEIWEPQRRYIWMKRWLETHRRRRAVRELLKRLQANCPQKAQQLAFGFL